MRSSNLLDWVGNNAPYFFLVILSLIAIMMSATLFVSGLYKKEIDPRCLSPPSPESILVEPVPPTDLNKQFVPQTVEFMTLKPP